MTQPKTIACVKSDFDKLLEEACNDIVKQYQLGMMYLNGFNIYMSGLDVKYIKNKDEAKKWLMKAAQEHHPNSLFMMGVCNFKGEFGAVNYATAVKWFELALKHKVIKSEYYLGKIENTRNHGKVTQKEVNHYAKAAQVGYADAQYEVALLYCMELLKDDENFSNTLLWATKAANQGHHEAQLIVKQLTNQSC